MVCISRDSPKIAHSVFELWYVLCQNMRILGKRIIKCIYFVLKAHVGLHLKWYHPFNNNLTKAYLHMVRVHAMYVKICHKIPLRE